MNTSPDVAHLCVTRHGETDWNRAGILQGWIDVPINDEGRRQARELASGFADSGFVGIHTSPLSRALETAQIIAERLGLPPPACHDGLKERNFGAVQGVSKAELDALDPALLQKILRRDPDCDFAGGESMHAFADRVLAALEHIAESHLGERVLVITHGWVMDVITRHIGGRPRNEILNLKRKNGESIWLAVTATTVQQD